jgi:hypothetical protein
MECSSVKRRSKEEKPYLFLVTCWVIVVDVANAATRLLQRDNGGSLSCSSQVSRVCPWHSQQENVKKGSCQAPFLHSVRLGSRGRRRERLVRPSLSSDSGSAQIVAQSRIIAAMLLEYVRPIVIGGFRQPTDRAAASPRSSSRRASVSGNLFKKKGAKKRQGGTGDLHHAESVGSRQR